MPHPLDKIKINPSVNNIKDIRGFDWSKLDEFIEEAKEIGDIIRRNEI